MIYKAIVNRENSLCKYIFTGRHIYCYIHALAETTLALNIANQIIINYDNKTDIDVYKLQLSEHNNYNEIVIAIDNMMTGNPHTYVEQIETIKYQKWFNTLYLDQETTNIMPPIKILDPIIKTDMNNSINFTEEDRTLY